MIVRSCAPRRFLQTCVPGKDPCFRQCVVSRTPNSIYLRQSSTGTDDSKKPYYVTTPIFYVNAAPHVGHLYSMVLADVLKRWQLLRGREAILCTGTDEHGMKVQRAANAAKTEPKIFCNQGAGVFQRLAAKIGLANDCFVRTTDSDHRDAVQYAWTVLREKDLLYLSKHEGWYSVSDETYYSQSAVHLIVDPPTGRKIMASKETGKEVEWTSETNYRFRLSSFKDRLLKYYEQNPNFIAPPSRMKDVVHAVSNGLEDLSVSRPTERLKWGIPVPADDSQTIYVWLDALINYITKAGYPWPPDQASSGGWPADCHVIGKDIIRFHCVYWPAFLLALDLPLPRQILTHAHWTLGREKMSKSTGNVVNPFFAIDRFGADTIRYYLAHDGGISQDADYGNEYIIQRYKKGLQGGLGNLASRTMRGKGWDVRIAVVRGTRGELLPNDDATEAQCNIIQQTTEKVEQTFEKSNVGAALQEIMNLIYATNAFMQHCQPWTILEQKRYNPDPRKDLDACIYLCSEALRLAGILLQPFMPDKARELLGMLGVDEDQRSFDFARLGADSGYGVPKIDVGRGYIGALFPPLISDS